ncbi:hypothetical protein [Phytohabitans houttuyneae]|uniref:hypothetical protein n=1 Tax=Phytohabitans houttuyneae TaxID=1076126 RepID=UPI0031E68599
MAGPPAALIGWAGWPLPTSRPDQAQLQQWLQQPLTAGTTAVAVWAVWAGLVYLVFLHPRRRWRHAMQALPSVAGAMALLVGLPVGLVWWAGWPLPPWPTQTQLQAWLAEPLTWPTIVTTSAIIGWLFWLMLVYALLVEVVTRIRRVAAWLPRMPIPTPMQGLVGGMFGAAALTMNTPTLNAGPAVDVGVVATVDQPLSTTATPAMLPPAGPQPIDAAHSAAGVELPGRGWLPEPVADAVTGAATLIWWRRRHRYQPHPPTGRARQDADLTPLPATVAAVQAAHPPTTLSPQKQPDLAQPVGGVVIGQAGLMPVQVGQLPAGGVGLVGPGGLDAARGVVAACLLAGVLAGPVRLLTTSPDLQTLLGRPTIHSRPDIQVTDNLTAALSILDRTVLDRSAGSAAASIADHEPLLLLTAAPTDSQTRSRLAVMLTLGHRFGITAMLLGGWSTGTTWPVDANGVVPDAAPAGLRLTVLTPAAAADLLELAQHASTPSPPPPAADPSQPAAASEQRPAADPAGVSLRLLGPVAVSAGGRPVTISRSAGLQTLVLLAIHPAGLTTAQLTQTLWPHQRPHLASKHLHTTIYDLRRSLSDATDLPVLGRTAGRYHLLPGHVDVDLWRSHDQVAHAATAVTPSARDTALRAVVSLYRDELATGETWPWLAPYREAARRDVIDAYTTLADAHPEQAAHLLAAAARLDPVNAAVHQRAADALTRNARR